MSISGGYKISGFVFEDDNFNRVKDPSEIGKGNVRIELWKEDGDSWTELKSVLTDNEGSFSFDAITGTYRIVEDDGNNYNNPFSGSDPTGYISTTPNSVERIITNNNINVDFGDFPGFKVEGYVFNDIGDGSSTSSKANNAFKDPIEEGISDVKVTLKNGTAEYIRYTDEKGKYTFYVYETPSFPIILTQKDLFGYTSTGDHDSTGSDPINERNRIVLNSLSEDNYNFADVRKIIIGGINSITVKPASVSILKHTLRVDTPGKVEFNISSNLELGTTVYNLKPDGTLGSEWDSGKILDIGIYDFAVFVSIPGTIEKTSVGGVFIEAVEYWNNSVGTDSDKVVDTVTITDYTLLLNKKVRNVTQDEYFVLNNEALPGDILEYKIIFENNGNHTLENVEIKDYINQHTSFLEKEYSGYDILFAINGNTYYLVSEENGDLNLDGASIINGKLLIDINRIMGDLQPGDSGYILYRVNVNE
jgi:uncharacterized repeat protein (TIGR01451 family)